MKPRAAADLSKLNAEIIAVWDSARSDTCKQRMYRVSTVILFVSEFPKALCGNMSAVRLGY